MPFENYIVFKFFRRNWERVRGWGGGGWGGGMLRFLNIKGG